MTRRPAAALPFAPDSVWNRALPAGEPIDPHSGAYVADLRRQLQIWVPWINTAHFSSPVYTVPAGQPTVRVAVDWNASAPLQAVWEHVPLPPGAQPSEDTDSMLIVWQPATDTLWEFWQLRRLGNGWTAHWGGRIEHVSRNHGYYTSPSTWAASASGLSWLGGLMRIDELRAGRIDHALALAIPEPRAGTFSWPAQRTDGTRDSPSAIPEGAHLRLDPNLDLNAIPMAPLTRVIARAAQRYGMIVRDRASAVALYAEDPTPTGSNPYSGPTGLFAGRYPSELLASFPWEHLQVLQTQLRSG